MIPVILSGGSGTRLWPVSRASYPKQFCEFFDRSFLDNTVARLKVLGDVHILTTKSMETLTARAVKRDGLQTKNVLYEPLGKNTAPAVALLCHVLELRGQSAEIVGVFPSDHLVGNEDAFRRVVGLAEKVAADGYVVTLGITPHQPETGYGYIEVKSDSIAAEGDLQAFRVAGFREKPNRATAETYIESGRHFWNAGMFVFRVADMIAHFKTLQPRMWERISQIDAEMSNAAYNYALVESISMDYAIMEKLERQACVPCDIQWSDVGSWDEMARLQDDAPLPSNSRAEVFNLNSENNYVFSVGNKVVGLIDIVDTVIVDTPDALLVAHKNSSQKVKELVDTMKSAGQLEATEHPFETRPWGRFEILSDDPKFKAKRITMDAGAQLSYQSHQHRSEHWVVITGRGEVTLNGEIISVGPREHIFIPEQQKHRMRNPGPEPLIFVEVQTGTYFGEDDITRFQDDYNRMPAQGTP